MRRVYIFSTLLLVALLSIATNIFARDLPALIPTDPALRHGVLRNGLTYYIRENRLPKGQADFYILSDVGAIQEEDDQQGLAHFLEHMAFNGTKSMPDKEIINYLESIGVKFGANLNASTSWDYTIYMMKDLPTARRQSVDSALLILRDWAGFITPKSEEIDKERGVIKEELRTRDGANWRSTLSLIAALGKGTKYEHRNLIGTLEGLDGFEGESLTRFYHDWYTPNHQAIIVVGDIDGEQVEAQLKREFKKLPAASRKAPKKEVIEVESNATPLINIYSDKEMQYSAVQYFIRRKAMSKEQAAEIGAAQKNVEETLISVMQNNRIDEVVMSPDAAILSGGMSLGSVGVIPTLEATTYAVQSSDGGVGEALREVVTQMERTRRYGFGSGEFERARRDLMSSARSQYLNRNDRTNNSFINRYVANYRFGEAIPSAEDEWQIDSTLLATATLEAVNRRVATLFKESDNVVSIVSPKREGITIPRESELLKIIEDVRSGDVTPYEESHGSEELLPNAERLSGSKVAKKGHNNDLKTTEWQLENGIQVTLRPSKLKADEVIISGSAAGGLSLLDDSEYITGSTLSSLISNSGIGDHSMVELTKVMAGKVAGVSTYVSEYSHGINGGSTPADIETLLQLVYLNFTSPRFSESDFESYKRRIRSNYQNQDSDPDYLANKRYAEVIYGGALRRMPLSLDLIDSLTFAPYAAVHERLFSDGDNFRFTIAGNFDVESIKPLVERYIGSLRVDRSNDKTAVRDLGIRPISGTIEDNFNVKMEQPKVGVQKLYWGEGIKYSLRNNIIMSYLKAALDDLLLESVREELGGTYGVGVSASISKQPFEHYRISLAYDTNEAQIKEMQATIYKQFEKIAAEGVTRERMDKSREFMLKNFGNMKEQNRGWISFIDALYINELDYINNYESTVKAITSDDVKKMAQIILKDNNHAEVIMHPKR